MTTLILISTILGSLATISSAIAAFVSGRVHHKVKQISDDLNGKELK